MAFIQTLIAVLRVVCDDEMHSIQYLCRMLLLSTCNENETV